MLLTDCVIIDFFVSLRKTALNLNEKYMDKEMREMKCTGFFGSKLIKAVSVNLKYT